MKSHTVEAEMFHADRQKDRQTDGWTDMTKLIDAFRNFANVPKNYTETVKPTVHKLWCYVNPADMLLA
jgi:hypothetical protein